MRHIASIIIALALSVTAVQAQKQTFNLPALFATNVFLFDNTNTPLHLRIAGSSVSNVQDWATLAAITNVDFGGFGATNIGFVGFDTEYTNGIAEGRLQWNTDAEKLEFGLVDGGLTYKIGDATIMRVRAAENILKGQVVSASGQTGNARPNVILADADSTNLIRRVPTGVALQNINNNASGYIITGGLATDLDTTAYPMDTPLYLSTTAGALTTNKPGHPLNGWIVGESVLSNATTGQLVINIAPCKQWAELDAQYVTLTNLSTIAGSGLGVVSNQLVATNVAGTFESLTGDRFSLGNHSVTNIDESSIGSYISANVEGSAEIKFEVYGARQAGRIVGAAEIGTDSHGAIQSGFVRQNSTVSMSMAAGALQMGDFIGTHEIQAAGAVQLGSFRGTSLITGEGAVQIAAGGGGQTRYISTGEGSLLIGPGTNDVAHSVKAAGGFYGSFHGNAANLTNFPSSILTVSASTNFWRITTAPTGATSFGSSGQMAVSGTNLFIYSPNALGVGTARWIRVSGEAAW